MEAQNNGFKNPNGPKRLSSLSVEELNNALEAANGLAEITPIVHELERRSNTDYKETTQPLTNAKPQEHRELQQPTQDDDERVPPHAFHKVGTVLFFILGYIFLIIAGIKLLVYWSDDFSADISLLSIAIYAALAILSLGFAHVLALIISISVQQR
jgi:hypothetical protein